MKKIKILFVASIWPCAEHTIRSGNIVFYELLRAFSNRKEVSISFLMLKNNRNDNQDLDIEENSIRDLKNIGVHVVDTIPISTSKSNKTRFSKIFSPTIIDFYPEVQCSEYITSVINKMDIDVLFIPWSEWITAACADVKAKKFAYYGNPDPKPQKYRINFDKKYGNRSKLPFWLREWRVKKLEKHHLAVMKKYEMVGNVAANDAEYYKESGHPNAFYIQNVWIDRFGDDWQKMRTQLEQHNPPIIVANVGKLNGTANTYGLDLLGREVLPALKQIQKDSRYQVSILGAQSMHPQMQENLQQPEVKIEGFVSDIDDYLLKSSVFLCINNGTPYKVGHTRYLHAWSLGCCVIAHIDARLSMPEIEHNKNALLGRDSKEIAELISLALSDRELRNRIGLAGYKSFKEYFVAEKVVNSILQKIQNNSAGN